MAIILTDQELINAKRDIDDIGKAVNQKEVVHPRYGDSFKSLPMIIDEFQISSDAAEAAAVSAEESSNIAQSSSQIAQDSAALAELAATAATIGGNVYITPEAGVDPVIGVADGAYFNVRSSSDESYVDEYQNVGGVATATGKSYLSSLGVAAQEKPASTIKDLSGKDQQELNTLQFRHNKSSATFTDYLTDSEIANSATTDLSAKLQAINDANEISKLRLTKGVYLVNSDVVFNRSFSFDLDADAFFKFGANGSIRFTGSAQLIGKPSANITRLNKTISIADTSLINEMDWLCIWNPTAFSYSPQREAYRAGEFVKVARKTANSFNIFGKTFESYNSADVEIYKVSPITINFNRFNVIASNTGLKNPVTFTFCENLDLSNYMNNGSLSSGITLDRCYNVTLPNLMATNNSALVGLNYGITIGNSQNVRIHGGNPLAARHCITTGGNGEICSVPCREIFITSMSLKSSDVVGIAAADFHGNTSDSYYQGCTMDHGAFGGKNITIRDCTVSNRVIDGSCLIFQGLIGGEVNIDNVTLNTSIASSSARSYIDITLLNDLKEDLVINIKDLKIYGDVASTSALIAFKCAPTVVVTKKITINIEVDSYVTQQGAFLNIQGGAAQPILPDVEINIIRANSKYKGVYYVHPTTTATAATTKLNLPKQIGSQLIITAGEATGIKHGDLITLPYYYPVQANPLVSVGGDGTWNVDSTFNLKPVGVMYYGNMTTQLRFALVSPSALPSTKTFKVSYEVGI